MELDFKFICPYLPYRVRFMGKRKGWVSFDGPMNLCTVDFDGRFEEIKPLLLPLSKFNNSEADEEIYEKYNLYISTSNLFFSLDDCSYGIMEILLKHHYDVFDLIKKGLAIDLTTIEGNK